MIRKILRSSKLWSCDLWIFVCSWNGFVQDDTYLTVCNVLTDKNLLEVNLDISRLTCNVSLFLMRIYGINILSHAVYRHCEICFWNITCKMNIAWNITTMNYYEKKALHWSISYWKIFLLSFILVALSVYSDIFFTEYTNSKIFSHYVMRICNKYM